MSEFQPPPLSIGADGHRRGNRVPGGSRGVLITVAALSNLARCDRSLYPVEQHRRDHGQEHLEAGRVNRASSSRRRVPNACGFPI